MDASHSDALVKPDMKAVLARTHVALDQHGFLLPMFEAISNAMDAIYARFGDDAKLKGQVLIRFKNANEPSRFVLTVTDNGVGLTDENYISFKTPFSGYKLTEKGRGFGRFISFKVFDLINYVSRYETSKPRSSSLILQSKDTVPRPT